MTRAKPAAPRPAADDNASPASTHLRATDLRGVGRLAVDATIALTDLAENLHATILRGRAPLGAETVGGAGGLTGQVYDGVRAVTRGVGHGMEALFNPLLALLGPAEGEKLPASPERLAVLAALNGVLGDRLAAQDNPLALAMHLSHQGTPLALAAGEPGIAPATVPAPGGRLLILVHGLCMHGGQWVRDGNDLGATLAAAGGFTPLALTYNSGLAIAENGRQFALQLQALVAAWPVKVDELLLVGHSMGGLVARSAIGVAERDGLRWRRRLGALVTIGTPHEGAPLERGGQWIDQLLGASPYSAAFARLGRVRSEGINDLRDARVVADGAWLPLPEGVDCYAVAGVLGGRGDGLQAALIGDGLVPRDSALGHHRLHARRLAFPETHQFVAEDCGHLALIASPAVAAQLVQWLVPPAGCRP